MANPEEIVSMQYDDFNRRTYRDNASRYISPDAVFIDGPTGEESYGPEGFIQYADMWSGAFSDAEVEVTSLEASGNTVYSTFIGRGTFDGELRTADGSVIKGNGGRLELEYTSETQVEDGMIVRDTTNYDMQEMMRQLGLG